MRNQDLYIEKDIESFISFQISLGHKRISYEASLCSFAKFMQENYPKAKNITRTMIIQYFEQETGELSRKASVLRLFTRYLNAIGKSAYEVPEDLYNTPHVNAPYIFSDKELHNLFLEIDSLQEARDGWFSTVAQVMFRLIYTCGLRPKEARELKRNCINFETGEILIEKSKNKKDRIVVMSDDMLNFCRIFDQKRRDAMIHSDFFFSKSNGKLYDESYINDVFKACWYKAAGVPESEKRKYKNIRVYCLRHRFATAVIHKWISQGIDLRNKLPYLQEYMGHNRLTDTFYYVHLLPENLVKSAGIDWESFDALIPEVTR